MIDLRQRRKELGLTMKQVADAVGVSEATISRYESGNIKNMRRDRLDKYARILQVEILDMIEFEEQISELNKEFSKDYEILTGYLKERFDDTDEVTAAYDLIIRLSVSTLPMSITSRHWNRFCLKYQMCSKLIS